MKVSVKELHAAIELKNNGMELEIRDTKDEFLGDLIITGTGLIWCNGRTKKANGFKIKWADFIAVMNANAADAKAKPARKAAKKAVGTPASRKP